jgi:sugar phosphate isomerase/epimerase
MTTRRNLILAGGALAALGVVGTQAQARDRWSKGGDMGMAVSAVPRLRPAGVAPMRGPPMDPLAYIDYCHGLGATGVEFNLAPDADLPALKARLETLGMFANVGARLPNAPGDMSAFEQSVKQAQYLGSQAMRAAMGGRRYEDFTTLDQFLEWQKRKDAIVELTVPICEKYKIPLAIENHKDRTCQQQAALLKRISSAYCGVLFDFGNNLAICETPAETLAALAPYVKSCHFKDMAVEPYAEGFLLSEVPAGTGLIDLAGTIATLRKHNPNLHLFQETITRDPLKIPINTEVYWATYPERRATHEAKMRAFVEAHKSKTPLRTLSTLSPQEQFAIAEDDARKGFAWVRAHKA